MQNTLIYLKQIENIEYFVSLPKDSEQLFLGSRVNKINISALIRHLIIAETYWINFISKLTNEATKMPMPKASEKILNIEDGNELVSLFEKSYKKNYNKLLSLSDLLL